MAVSTNRGWRILHMENFSIYAWDAWAAIPSAPYIIPVTGSALPHDPSPESAGLMIIDSPEQLHIRAMGHSHRFTPSV